MRHIYFTVTNDLSYDQRMDRICSTLAANGYACTLVGRKRRSSKELASKTYNQVRLNCWFDKGKLFYIEYNLRLFFYLIFKRKDFVCAIDLDSFLPCYVSNLIQRKKLIYDAHEFFSELEEIVTRPLIHKAWLSLEKFAMKRIKHGYTISDGYASLFRDRYGQQFDVIRNVSVFEPVENVPTSEESFIIYQGALNVGRGLEEAVLAMHDVASVRLRIYGDGPIREDLRKLIEKEGLTEKVELMGAVPPNELKKITPGAKLGLTLFSSTGLHHKYSMANRFFDYFHAGIPQIAMNYPEYSAFNEAHPIAILIDNLTAKSVAEAINKLLDNNALMQEMKQACHKAADEVNWQSESKKLIHFYNQL